MQVKLTLKVKRLLKYSCHSIKSPSYLAVSVLNIVNANEVAVMQYKMAQAMAALINNMLHHDNKYSLLTYLHSIYLILDG